MSDTTLNDAALEISAAEGLDTKAQSFFAQTPPMPSSISKTMLEKPHDAESLAMINPTRPPPTMQRSAWCSEVMDDALSLDG